MSGPFVYVTYIYTTPQKVWDAITKPEFAKRYWFNYNVSDWKMGSRWEHRKGDDSGTVMVDGTVLESDPPHRLVTTWTRPDKSKEPSRVTYDIAQYGPGLVCLTVTHDQLERDPAMANGISGGWPKVLSNLKSLLETGKTENIWLTQNKGG
ncbi:MAG: SRPBCC family protein [Proteobacteria bacterium]|nr:SRPBCC family protein [Pseudomonadota bacterium]